MQEIQGNDGRYLTLEKIPFDRGFNFIQFILITRICHSMLHLIGNCQCK